MSNKEKKEPRILGSPDVSMSFHTEGTTVQMGGRQHSGHAMGQNIWGETLAHSENTALVRKRCWSCGTERRLCKVCYSESTIRRPTTLARKGQERSRLGGDNTEKLKAVRGFLDGSNKRDGWSGCGVVIKGVDTHLYCGTFSVK